MDGPATDRSEARLFAGVELGGTKCICTLAAGPDDIRDQQMIATTVPSETLPAILAVLDGWARSPGFCSIGVASFGPIRVDPAKADYGRVGATNKPDWEGADLLGPLRSAFPSRSVSTPTSMARRSPKSAGAADADSTTSPM